MRSFNLRQLLFASAAAAALSGTVACSDGGGDGGNGAAEECHDYSKFEGAVPSVSFQATILPVFQRSCGVAGANCHGSESGTAGKTYLGPPLGTAITPAELLAIQTQNVGVDSTAKSGMKRIVAGDPTNSFLIHKIDGDFSCELLACAPDCGSKMPPVGDDSGLPADERDAIRRWISQGAKVE